MIPTTGYIEKRLDIPKETAREIRLIMESPEYAETTPAGDARIRECYNPPTNVDIQMHAINAVLETCGVEYIAHPNDTYSDVYGLEYCNTGDTYIDTICFDNSTCRFLVCSWGAWVESMEARGVAIA